MVDTDQHVKGLPSFMDDMPGIEDTIRANEFLNSGFKDFAPNEKPTYKRGDTVWL